MTITERAWQQKIVDAARWYGWHVFHPYDMRRSEPGWPDLTLIKGDRLVFAELKSERGRVSPAQHHVLELLRGTAAEVFVWRPSDWPEVQQVLATKATTHA